MRKPACRKNDNDDNENISVKMTITRMKKKKKQIIIKLTMIRIKKKCIVWIAIKKKWESKSIIKLAITRWERQRIVHHKTRRRGLECIQLRFKELNTLTVAGLRFAVFGFFMEDLHRRLNPHVFPGFCACAVWNIQSLSALR